MDISAFDKAKVLCALYNASQPVGMGLLQSRPGDLDIEEARELLKTQTYFDYLHGRSLKIDLKGDELDTRLYDRDHGTDAAEIAILDEMTIASIISRAKPETLARMLIDQDPQAEKNEPDASDKKPEPA